jgi:glutathione S-transferase
MLTLFHAPHSRSMVVMSLIDEMGIADRVRVEVVDIRRQDGSGGFDPANPHPEHKVPALRDDGVLITERGAIMTYLTSRFPEAGLAPRPEDRLWGEFLTWMVWYGSVMEPVLILEAAGVSHDWLVAAIRTHAEVKARLLAALEKGPWLMGETFSAADILCSGPYHWFKEATPDDPLIRDWVARCAARPASLRVAAADAALMGQRAA